MIEYIDWVPTNKILDITKCWFNVRYMKRKNSVLTILVRYINSSNNGEDAISKNKGLILIWKNYLSFTRTEEKGIYNQFSQYGTPMRPFFKKKIVTYVGSVSKHNSKNLKYLNHYVIVDDNYMYEIASEEEPKVRIFEA